MSWEANAVQLAGLAKQTKTRGLWDATLARCTPATREAVAQPHAARWHPGAVLVDFSEALMAASDAATFEAINYDMSRESFGPILRPLVQVAMALSGRSPSTILERMPASVSQAVRNVSCVWTPQGPKQGLLSFSYPEDISANAQYAWRGAIRFVSELSGQPIRETSFVYRGGRVFEFSLAWD